MGGFAVKEREFGAALEMRTLLLRSLELRGGDEGSPSAHTNVARITPQSWLGDLSHGLETSVMAWRPWPRLGNLCHSLVPLPASLRNTYGNMEPRDGETKQAISQISANTVVVQGLAMTRNC